jgi:hypothetical protein
LVSIIIRFSSGFALYSFYVCFRKYQFSYLFLVFLYSFLISHKNIKTNMAPLYSVCFRSVFIHTNPYNRGSIGDAVAASLESDGPDSADSAHFGRLTSAPLMGSHAARYHVRVIGSHVTRANTAHNSNMRAHNQVYI